MRKKKDLELLSLIPYTKGPIQGKGNKSFVEKLLLPRRVRMTIAEKGSYISTNSIKSKRVLPTTPPEIFQKPKTRGALKDTDLEKYEEYFRSSRYFQVGGCRVSMASMLRGRRHGGHDLSGGRRERTVY